MGEYYRPGDRMGGYPGGPELGEDGPAYGGASEMGLTDRGYGLPGYVDDGYGRRRPLGGEYVGGAPEYYGERPGGYGYAGYPPQGYSQGYPPQGYPQGYPPQGYPHQQVIVSPPVEYVQPEPSDLGTGLRDSHFVSRHHPHDYGADYGRSDLGYSGAPGYGRTEYDEAEMRRLRKEVEHERHRKHEFELATAAALGYGLHERHEKNEAEEELERYEPGYERRKERRHHHHYRGD